MSLFKVECCTIWTEKYLKDNPHLACFVRGHVYNAKSGSDKNKIIVFDDAGHEVVCDKDDFKIVSQIQDSGSRRSFKTGAVRDIDDSKGRCDLLPLDIVSKIMNNDQVLGYLSNFKDSTFKDTDYLDLALAEFCQAAYKDDTTEMLLEVSIHFKEGALKYGENNWQKGLPVYCYLDSAIRHYLKYLRGDNDEPHDRAFVWNIMCMWWTIVKEIEVN